MIGKKQIAVLLILVFTLPVLYQPLHILRHHVDPDSYSFHRNHLEEHEVLTSAQGDEAPVSVSAESDKKHCPICDYKVTFNQIPSEFRFAASFRHCVEIKFCFINEFHEESVYSTVSPRGPPCETLFQLS